MSVTLNKGSIAAWPNIYVDYVLDGCGLWCFSFGPASYCLVLFAFDILWRQEPVQARLTKITTKHVHTQTPNNMLLFIMFDCESIFQAGQFSGRHEFLYHKKSTWRNQQNNIYRWFTHSMLPHHVDERWFLASERTDLHEIHSQKMFWFVEKLLCNDRDCVVSSTSNTGKTIFKEKNGATSWIVILVYLLVSPFHETHCSWRDEFLIWISLYFPEEFSLNSWIVFGGHGCGRSKKHF